MQEMKDDIFEGVLGEVNLSSADSPDIQNMSPGNFKRGCVGGGVEILPGSGMARHYSG